MTTENAGQRFARYQKTLLDIIHKRLPQCKIYLFGSRARGTHREGADIDLALDCGAPIDWNIITKLYCDIDETTIPLMIDLVDLHTASDLLKNEVKKEGVLWTN